MSSRFDNVADYMERTSISGGAYSIMGWACMKTDRNTFSALFGFDEAAVGAGTGTSFGYLSDSDGTTFGLWDGDSFVGSKAVTVGVPFFWAATFAGVSTSDACTFNMRIATEAALTSNSGTLFVGGTSPTRFHLGNNAYSEFFNGWIAAVKVYSAVLTSTELMAESLQMAPVRWTNLIGLYPMWSIANDEVDHSANGNNWTVGGTLASEEGPPIPWRRSAPAAWSFGVVDEPEPPTPAGELLLLGVG